MKKIIFLVSICTLAVLSCGCNRMSKDEFKQENSKNASQEKISESTSIKVSDLFTNEDRKIWFYTENEESTLSYQDEVYAVYVVENGKATGYTGVGKLADYDELTDDEIIQYLEEKNAMSGYQEKTFYDGECTIDFSYILDNTGNFIEKQGIKFELVQDKGIYNSGLSFEIAEILNDPQTILSKQYFGFVNDAGSRFITRYDYDGEIEIVLNELGDEVFGETGTQSEDNVLEQLEKEKEDIKIIETIYSAFLSNIVMKQVGMPDNDITLTIGYDGIVVSDTESFNDEFIISFAEALDVQTEATTLEEIKTPLIEATINKLCSDKVDLETGIICTMCSTGEITVQCGEIISSNRNVSY